MLLVYGFGIWFWYMLLVYGFVLNMLPFNSYLLQVFGWMCMKWYMHIMVLNGWIFMDGMNGWMCGGMED